MQLTVHVPDDMIDAVRSKLPPLESGVIEAVALDAVLGFLMKLDGSTATGEKANPLSQLLNFIFKLQEKKISFRLECVRESIMVVIPTPSKYSEVEFFEDGHIEVQTFGPGTDVDTIGFDAVVAAVLKDTVGDNN